MAKTQTLEFPNFKWIDIENPDAFTMEQLAKDYDFHPLDIADTLSVSHRSKADVYPKYTFLVFIFPLFNRQKREIEPAEINFFVGKDFIVTAHQGTLNVFREFFHTFHISPDLRHRYADKSPERLVYEILYKLLLYTFPMVDHLSDDCNQIEKEIFSGKEKRMISEILMIRRNIIDFRKIMQVHKNVLKKASLNFKDNPIYVMKKTDVYFDNLTNYAKEVWDTLENLKERIEAIQASNESQISFRLADTMRTLTVISVSMLPVTLIATLFGMNTKGVPFSQDQSGFWYAVGLMALMVIGVVVYFRKKGWM